MLRHDKQLCTDKIATQAGSLQRCLYKLLTAVNIRPKNLGSIKDINGNQLSDQAAILTRWKEHFSELLSRPVPSPPQCLMAAEERPLWMSPFDYSPNLD